MKKTALLGMLTITAIGLGACGSASGAGEKSSDKISVISREEGSGTRGAFTELFGIEVKENGEKVDHTTAAAEITNSTSVMLTTIAGNQNAVGYISLGSLNDTVKALEIDGVAPSAAGVKDGSYKIARPFNIVQKDSNNQLAEDFVAFILSRDGQQVVLDNGYISKEAGADHTASQISGKLVVAGSSSVTPVMEKLKEAYLTENTAATIDIQQSDSTTGVSATQEGIADIGMVSRDLADSEQELISTVIALDGIAVVVNKEQTVTALTSDQVKAIFTGTVTQWSELTKN